MDLTNLTTSLSDLHVVAIVWFTLALTVARLAFIKMPGLAMRAIVEVIEAALIAGILVFLIIQPFFAKNFYIPSGSMLPTLLVDDHIVVNRLVYRFEQPSHDDVVVFNAPQQALEQSMDNSTTNEPVDYIKRLIGLPGDTIQVVGGTITINGATYHHSDARPRFGLSNDDPDSRDQQHLKFVSDGVEVYDGKRWTKYSLSEVAERFNATPNAIVTISPGYVIRNGQRLNEPFIAEDPDYDLKLSQHGDVLLSDPGDGVHINGELPDNDNEVTSIEKGAAGKIPPGEVMVMGDNRNDSNDSSRWGPLDETRLVGKAVFIFFPFNRIQPIR